MCFCRRKTSSKEDVDPNPPLEGGSKKVKHEQPLPAPNAPNGPNAPVAAKEVKEEEKKKSKIPSSLPRSQKSKKKQKKKTADDDTITNIPDEMPDLEINREHPEPFYTDEQLM